mmetsp:Transcript_35813/g.83174  ORF Transcript_35813/g.83174 Transcript_35813/m.83174 type:complete len:165 (+) Transcript_35813:1-495(+)
MDGTDGTGGCLQVVPDSHTTDYTEFMATHLHIKGRNLTMVPLGHPLRQRMVRVISPDRGMVVWKNETFHCNSPNGSHLFRVAQYVNMCPASTVDAKAVARRVKMFARGAASTHWVNAPAQASMPVAGFVPPTLSAQGYKLLGGDTAAIAEQVKVWEQEVAARMP